jgi:hypothetical protein
VHQGAIASTEVWEVWGVEGWRGRFVAKSAAEELVPFFIKNGTKPLFMKSGLAGWHEKFAAYLRGDCGECLTRVLSMLQKGSVKNRQGSFRCLTGVGYYLPPSLAKGGRSRVRLLREGQAWGLV